MGQLKPGATYIYERADGVTYAREAGSLHREAIGWDADSKHNPDLIANFKEDKLWVAIRQAAESNPLLQETLDRAKILYELSKKDGEK